MLGMGIFDVRSHSGDGLGNYFSRIAYQESAVLVIPWRDVKMMLEIRALAFRASIEYGCEIVALATVARDLVSCG